MSVQMNIYIYIYIYNFMIIIIFKRHDIAFSYYFCCFGKKIILVYMCIYIYICIHITDINIFDLMYLIIK